MTIFHDEFISESNHSITPILIWKNVMTYGPFGSHKRQCILINCVSHVISYCKLIKILDAPLLSVGSPSFLHLAIPQHCELYQRNHQTGSTIFVL